jgi:protein-tyrosine-phosphatase
MPSVLFVCTANRFRSPLAAALFQKALRESTDPEVRSILQRGGSWQAGSAGTWALPGQPILPEVEPAAQKLGLDLADHSSRCVSTELLAGYDLILVMQASQKEALLSEFPLLEERIYLFSQTVEGRTYDIPDSFGSEEAVGQVAAAMDELMRRGLRYILVLALALHNKRNWTAEAL